MALQQMTFNIGALEDSLAGGKNYISGQVYEVFNTNDTLASIFSDAGGATPIIQDGISNVSDSDGEVNFYIGSGGYYFTTGGKRRDFTPGIDDQLINDLSQAYEFTTLQEAIDFDELVVYKVINLSGLNTKGDELGGVWDVYPENTFTYDSNHVAHSTLPLQLVRRINRDTFKSENSYSAVDNMIAGRIGGSVVVTHKIGSLYVSGETGWVVDSLSNPMDISNFSPTTNLHAKDFSSTGVATDAEFRACLSVQETNTSHLDVNCAVECTAPVTVSGSVTFYRDKPVSLIQDIGNGNFLKIGLNAKFSGYLKVVVSGVTCHHPAWFDGGLLYSSDNSPVIESIELQGESHTSTTGGLGYVAIDNSGVTQSFVQYTSIGFAYIRFCNYGVYMIASDNSAGRVWCNGNTIVNLKAATCRTFLWMESVNTEVTSNTILNYTFQYGARYGSHPSQAIALTGDCSGNTIYGFTYDWQFENSDSLPVVTLGGETHDNRIKHSSLSLQVRDSGYRNSLITSADNSRANLWASQFESNYLGNQDNSLAHFEGVTGLVTPTVEVWGAGGLVGSNNYEAVLQENHEVLSLDFTVPNTPTDGARYSLEFRPQSNRPLNMNGVYIKFEEGFTPDSVRVEVDPGTAVFIAAGDVSFIENGDVFIKFDAVFDNGDSVGQVRAIKIFIQCIETKQVRVRQVCANGGYATTYPSRGGDRMIGDLLFEDEATSPVLTSDDGTQFRLKVSNGGALTTETVGGGNPELKLTWS
ncbi:hypothetical protein OAA60_03515 [Porticoccaceae bacterium]|nr:hypothetical protein [Porticoccaceae bacterium]